MSDSESTRRIIASEQLYVDYEGHSKTSLLLQVYEPQLGPPHPYNCRVEMSLDGDVHRECHCPGVSDLQALIQGLNYLQINLNHFVLSRKAVIYILYYKDEEKREPVYGEIDFRVIFQNIDYY